jgi:hypothetical protein
MERLSLKKLNYMDGKEQYCVEGPNSSAALKDLDAEMDISSTWKTMLTI